jgi:hypothetical protein
MEQSFFWTIIVAQLVKKSPSSYSTINYATSLKVAGSRPDEMYEFSLFT